MATKVVIPTKVVTTDDKAGNWYTIMSGINHTSNSGADTTDVELPASAVSVAELPTSGNGITKANLTITDPTSGDGKVVARFATGAADGTYTIVVRYIGSAAGYDSSHVA